MASLNMTMSALTRVALSQVHTTRKYRVPLLSHSRLPVSMVFCSVAVQEAATAARQRAAGLAADALFAAEEGGEEEQPSPADADAGDEDEAERQYRLELGRELQARARSWLGSGCNLTTAVLLLCQLCIAALQLQQPSMQHEAMILSSCK